MKHIITLILLFITIQITSAQKQNKGYIKYNLELSKHVTEMATMEKIEDMYRNNLELAWNKDWALMRKNSNNVDIYFLCDREEQNQNVYIHFLDTGKKIVFPIEKGFEKDFEFFKLLGKYEWTKTEEVRTIENLTCRVYKLKVEAYPYEVNEWCISEENLPYFDYHPFYQDQSLGLPISMITGSSIKQKYTIGENSKNISDQLSQFNKKEYQAQSHLVFKRENILLYNAMFRAF